MTTNVRISPKSIQDADKKFIRLVLQEGNPELHRLVEKQDGITEYRMGVAKLKDMTPRNFITFVRSIVRAAQAHQIEHLAVELDYRAFTHLTKIYDEHWIARSFAENLLIANYEFTAYKSEPSKKKTLKEILVCGKMSASTKKVFEHGLTVATCVNKARDISNATADDMTPVKLAKAAQDAVKGTKTTVKVLGEKELKNLKMGLLLAVGRGTEHESKFIILEYWGAGRETGSKKNGNKPIVLVGKGITYDTGGLNLKPGGFMHDMHMDMSGGAAVIATLACAAQLGIKKNIIGLVPAAENAISDTAMRPGDIVTAMNGKTVEILNTDAEGRMALGDALTYAQRYEPKVVLDIATLTGAALVALGQHASAILTADKKLQQTLSEQGERSGDYVWPLPLWDEYQQYIKSARADISNISTSFSRYGGTIEGAIFLSHFAPKCPWAHIDMAPRMESIASDKLAKGSTGEPVRLLVSFIENY